MATYRLSAIGVENTETGAFIPNDVENIHWREYQAWLAAGNVPDPARPDPVPPTLRQRAVRSLNDDPALGGLLTALATRLGVPVLTLMTEVADGAEAFRPEIV